MKAKNKPIVAVIGGGASGLTAAIFSARRGANVIILEHNNRIGKKILVTGNGKCNLTNRNMGENYYHSENPDFPGEVLKQFSLKDTLNFFEQLGIYFLDRNGYLYPNSGQASSVLDVLHMEVEHLGIEILTGEHVEKIQKEREKFYITTDKKVYQAERVILASGSKAAPKQGSDGSGYQLAKVLGHRIITPLPALVPLCSSGSFLKHWAGVRTEGRISIFADEIELASDQGELQLTDSGISGIPVFQVSSYAAKALEKGKKVNAVIDFFPQMELWEFKRLLEQRYARMEYKTIEEGLNGIFHKKLITAVLCHTKIAPGRFWKTLEKKEKERFALTWKQFSLPIRSTKSFEQAQVCAGGVDTREVNPRTMQSRLVEGLYLVGELLDVDGICGGYNLQWAWSTGAIAGSAAI